MLRRHQLMHRQRNRLGLRLQHLRKRRRPQIFRIPWLRYQAPVTFVQVAAVSKPEDADALVDALKKKQYPAFVVNNSTSDKLYRVQTGPFGDIKEAEAMRARLINDGYNPILKK